MERTDRHLILRTGLDRFWGVILLVCFSIVVFQPGWARTAEKRKMTVVFVDGQGRELCRFRAETAATPAEQTRGLMFRKSLPADAGMLFLGSSDEIRSFWMKNTYIPLDLIFINGGNVVKHVHYGARPLDLNPINSRFPVQYVLEVNAGQARKCKIDQGVMTRFVY